MDIQPGARVKVTVKSPIKTTRAGKTLARIFMRDGEVRKKRLVRPKQVIQSTRAGRLWDHRPEGSNQLPPNVGDSANIIATVDVIRDLHSVEPFIEVK